jgi:hypothetical protein
MLKKATRSVLENTVAFSFSLFIKGYDQLVVPFFSEFPDQGSFQVDIQRFTLLFAIDQCRCANRPLVVVDRGGVAYL